MTDTADRIEPTDPKIHEHFERIFDIAHAADFSKWNGNMFQKIGTRFVDHGYRHQDNFMVLIDNSRDWYNLKTWRVYIVACRRGGQRGELIDRGAQDLTIEEAVRQGQELYAKYQATEEAIKLAKIAR
jgi:hypothetical protein